MTAPGPNLRIAVVCAIIERANAFLSARRGPGQTNSGLWEFPGGKVHPGETPERALERELDEELDVEIIPHARLKSCLHDYPWISIELIPFICKISKGEPHPREHDEIRWITLADAGDLNWSAADISVLKEYEEIRSR